MFRWSRSIHLYVLRQRMEFRNIGLRKHIIGAEETYTQGPPFGPPGLYAARRWIPRRYIHRFCYGKARQKRWVLSCDLNRRRVEGDFLRQTGSEFQTAGATKVKERSHHDNKHTHVFSSFSFYIQSLPYLSWLTLQQRMQVYTCLKKFTKITKETAKCLGRNRKYEHSKAQIAKASS